VADRSGNYPDRDRPQQAAGHPGDAAQEEGGREIAPAAAIGPASFSTILGAFSAPRRTVSFQAGCWTSIVGDANANVLVGGTGRNILIGDGLAGAWFDRGKHG
jgi:hypothetical protein